MNNFNRPWPESAWPTRQPLDTLTAIDLAKLRTIIDETTLAFSFFPNDLMRREFSDQVINRIIATAAPSVKGK